ncbi:MAG: MBL fold metallo-hydrolase [Eubacterium sp.]|nr:MBL fold metallo-hydrolase [Eubacterium sp.]
MMKVKFDTFGSMANNAFLIVDESTNCSALIDCPEYSDKMVKLIGDTELKYIILTHGHFDHILGVKEVCDKYGCKVYISKEDAPMLQSGKLSLGAFCGFSQNSVSDYETVSDGDEIVLGALKIKALATPGHTKGGMCYICGDYLFTGDTLFCESYGRVDFPGGDLGELTASVKKLKELDGDFKVMTGHEELSTLEHERRYNPMMRAL